MDRDHRPLLLEEGDEHAAERVPVHLPAPRDFQWGGPQKPVKRFKDLIVLLPFLTQTSSSDRPISKVIPLAIWSCLIFSGTHFVKVRLVI